MELRIKPLGIITILALIAITVGIAWAVSNNLGKQQIVNEIKPDEGIGGEILFATSKTKKDWLDEQSELFNQQYADKKVKVIIEYGETRDSYQDIINGKKNVALWGPSSTAWIGALGNYWQTNKGKPLFDTAKPEEYKIYLKTPMVLLTTKDKVAHLQPLLAANGKTWDNLRDLSTGKIPCPWGKFKYSYADPINAGSGFMVLSMVLTDFTSKHPEINGTDAVVKSKAFAEYMKALNTSYIYDEPAFKGSTDLLKSFLADPKKYDFIVTYESNALKEALNDPKLAVIYPNPTATTDMSIVAFTGADWLTPEQKKGAKLFMQFLSEKNAMEAGVKTAFRTANPMPGISLNPELKKVAAQGFQESFTASELPSYEPVNEAAANWRKLMKPSATIVALMQEKDSKEAKK